MSSVIRAGDARKSHREKIRSSRASIARSTCWVRCDVERSSSDVSGAQGYGVESVYLRSIAVAKHPFAYDVENPPGAPARYGFNAIVSVEDLQESYFPQFRATFTEGGARSLMSSYNAVNGVPMSGNQELLDMARNKLVCTRVWFSC